MFDEFSMIDPGPLAKYVGFTEEEVSELCERYGMDMQELKAGMTDILLKEHLLFIVHVQ